jgi:hypothetical protein
MRILTIAALILSLGTPAVVQAENASKPASASACHAEADKTAKCAPAKPRKKKPASDEGLRAQSFTQCRDVRTHSPTKCGGPYAEPQPAN